jgi:hypothetical protein
MNFPTFQQWVTIKEAKSEEEKQAYNDFISGKSNKLVLKSSLTNVARGHQGHQTGSGAHDSRPSRERTRQGQQKRWKKDQLD